MILNREATYSEIRKTFGKLSTKQVEGFEAVFDEFERLNISDKRYLAYILATIWHEVATTMQPIEEFGKGKVRKYGQRVWFSGKRYSDVPHIYYGRGHVQNTWRDTYRKLTVAANKQGFEWDFENSPNLLLQMKPSIWATFYAMQSGLYTGRKLSDFFNVKITDPLNARKIINGTDKNKLIASYYQKFLTCLNKK